MGEPSWRYLIKAINTGIPMKKEASEIINLGQGIMIMVAN